MKDIRRIFYECIVPEATIGKIKAYFCYGLAFSTMIQENAKTYKCTLDDDNIFIPTLIIKDKELFDSLLEEYVRLAIKFYDDNNFYEEILNYKLYNEKDMVCKEKVIIMNLFANATTDDFMDPISFLRKRIDFLNNYYKEHIDLGYSDILKCYLTLDIDKDTINNETPSKFVIRAKLDDDEFIFPMVKFGISNDTVYIYAIQNGRNIENSLSKKINRKLYKVGEGFTDQNLEENPRDITASFLVVLNMAISYFNSIGYTNIVVPSILIERWNAKIITTNNMYKNEKIDINKKEERDLTQENIQSNLTNKLIRTFLRLGCHYNNIDIVAFPYENDSSLHVKMNNNIDLVCNNQLLLDTSDMVRNGINKKEKKK